MEKLIDFLVSKMENDDFYKEFEEGDFKKFATGLVYNQFIHKKFFLCIDEEQIFYDIISGEFEWENWFLEMWFKYKSEIIQVYIDEDPHLQNYSFDVFSMIAEIDIQDYTIDDIPDLYIDCENEAKGEVEIDNYEDKLHNEDDYYDH